ncbi:MAG: uroporphyrinogen-III synthase [Bacteroidales bacterium]|jgi:uroporphyrinogen-III synthase|nr:uroporphyrinogen-III synthase [Bacteroidales bacterium]
MKIKNILISQNAPADIEKSPYGDLKKKYSINIDFYKFFKIQNVSAIDFRKTKVNILEHQAIIFYSKNTIDNFFDLCKEMRLVMPETMKYFCSTEAVAVYLQKYIQFRKRKIFFSKDSSISNFHEILLKNKELQMLVPCGQSGANPELLAFLQEHEIRYHEAIVFETLSANLKENIDISKYDMIVLYSPNGVHSLKENYPDFEQGDITFAALGHSVVSALEEQGLTAQVTAPTAEYASITDAIDAYLKDNATRRR